MAAKNLLTGASAFAIARVAPAPPLVRFQQSGGQIAAAVDMVTARWGDPDSDPIADIERWVAHYRTIPHGW